MPQSSVALRQKADALRLLRHPSTLLKSDPQQRTPARPVWAKAAFTVKQGSCLALEVREGSLWVHVKPLEGDALWLPVDRVLSGDQRRAWARSGFG